MPDMEQISSALVKGEVDRAKELTQAAIDGGASPQAVLNEGLVAGMNVISEQFRDGETFIPDVLMAAKAMHAGMEVLEPLLGAGDVRTLGVVVIGTVKGDVHDIGKHLVGVMLEGAGFRVVDLGSDVAPEQFVSAAQAEDAQIVAMSALLTTTMPSMKATVEALEEAGLKGKVKTMIGGAPVTQDFADLIGADGYGEDASEAIDAAKELGGA